MSQFQSTLAAQWSAFRAENPQVRIRDAAQQLNTSEADLLATDIGKSSTYLRADWKMLLQRLATLGTVMALTRSDDIVHEITGHFTQVEYRDDNALFFRPGLDTRYFLKQWHYGFAVNGNNRHSLQFFDAYGQAVHKIYLTKDSDASAYQALVHELESPLPPDFKTEAALPSCFPESLESTSINHQQLQQAWANIRNVHEGNRIIRQMGGNRLAIYQALGEAYAERLTVDYIEPLLTACAEKAIPITLFAMNQGAVQSYSGTIQRLLRTGAWFNILDPSFNLHLRTQALESGSVWRIRKPSDEGVIHSINILDQYGNDGMILIAQRKRGEPEPENFRQLVSNS